MLNNHIMHINYKWKNNFKFEFRGRKRALKDKIKAKEEVRYWSVRYFGEKNFILSIYIGKKLITRYFYTHCHGMLYQEHDIYIPEGEDIIIKVDKRNSIAIGDYDCFVEFTCIE